MPRLNIRTGTRIGTKEAPSIEGLGLLVTGRISAELAFKAARAGVPLVGRAVSGHPPIHHGDT